MLAQVLGPAIVLALTRGHSPLKLVFNLAQFGLTACLAVITLHALAPAPQALGPGSVAGRVRRRARERADRRDARVRAIALAEGVFPSRRMALMMGADLLVALTNTSVGLAGATLLAEDRRAGWLLLAPACVLLLAYRAYMSERTKHESLEFLYGVARSLSRAPDIESALVDLLRRTRETFRVEVAEIVLFSGDQPLRTALDRRGPRDAHGAARARARRRAAATSSATSRPPCSWSASRHRAARALPGPRAGSSRRWSRRCRARRG